MQSWRPIAIAMLGTALAVACSGRERRAEWPEGAWLIGRSAALDRALAGLESLHGTPLGRRAAQARERLTGCEEFVATTAQADSAALLERLRCRAGEPLPPSLSRLRGESDLAFVLPIGDEARLLGSGRVAEDGSVALDARLDGRTPEGLAGLFVPAREPAGPPLLSGRESLLHARLRPQAGLDLASRISAAGQADHLFRLKSRIFEGSALGGAWELVLYAPAPGRATPAIALALDVAMPELAAGAMRQFVRELEETWPIRHTATGFGPFEGACFLDLRILPEFAPCYVTTASAVVVGWNAESVERALDPAPEPGLAAEGGIVLHLARLPAADARLQSIRGLEVSEGVGYDDAWQRLGLRGLREQENIV